jgi:GR25 family glycosyltransferase involved in LPS biosynthesis
MKLSGRPTGPISHIFRFWLRLRKLFPKQRCHCFGARSTRPPGIEKIYVINLDREPGRWSGIVKELRHILDSAGASILDLTERYAAVDAAEFNSHLLRHEDIDPIYTLRDQLFVEPQPSSLPTAYKLDTSIQMSKAEVAVAQSHINVWRKTAAGDHPYVLILEDDVWFHSEFAQCLDQTWNEIVTGSDGTGAFDVLYVSYLEVKHGAPKLSETRNVFRPERGLWHLSGYILSREGATKLLQMLPCRGPIDLWINHHFKQLNVIATKRSLVEQRYDGGSANSYSILPALTAIGAINSEGPALFNVQQKAQPVFAFGPDGSGLSSLAMALSMLGYRCCNDIQRLPDPELSRLLEGNQDRLFDAYVNVGSLDAIVSTLKQNYPSAKFVIITSSKTIGQKEHLAFYDLLAGTDVRCIDATIANPWQSICEHLRCAPPICSYPVLKDVGQRSISDQCIGMDDLPASKRLKSDKSPWVIEPYKAWDGIRCVPTVRETLDVGTPVSVHDRLECISQKRWVLRDDTFTDNLALFRPGNIELKPQGGIVLHVKKECLGVRAFSGAALSSQEEYMFGKFEAVIQASNSPGIVTGIFLHRNSPRQEIDIEIAGNRPNRLLVNVFYNPGGEGANFDYGFRGAPSVIDLGFDASEAEHRFAIEWTPCEIRWFVDDKLVHRRSMWDPTPIPHLPMTFHVNSWPSRSTELAGRVKDRFLPSTAIVSSIDILANCINSSYPAGGAQPSAS